MAVGLTIDAKELLNGAKLFDAIAKKLPSKIHDILNANAEDIVTRAKNDAPADRGDLRKYISFKSVKLAEIHITCNVPYAAYIEFGTGRYAAQQVSKYPGEYQKFAAQYRTGNRQFPPIKLIMEWVIRKGIVATYDIRSRNIKTRAGRRIGTGKSKAEQKRAAQMAYVIARSIFMNGIHPHPFMIPAFIDQQLKIIKDFKILLEKLKNLNV